MKTSRIFVSLTQQGAETHIATADSCLKIIFLKDDVVRIRCTFEDHFPEEASYALMTTAWDDRMDPLLKDFRTRVTPVTPEMKETERGYTLTTALLVLRVDKAPFGISVYSHDGVLLHADVRERSWMQDDQGRISHHSAFSPQDGYYGFGEKTGTLNKAHRRMRMHNVDTLGYDAEKTDPLYKHIPFYIRMNRDNRVACGMFYHNAWPSVFDMGCERSGYWQRYSSFCADGGELDLFLMYGPSMARVVAHYTDLTGKTVLPPKAALGYMGSTMYYTELDQGSDEAILSFFDKAEKEGMPCDGFHMSSGYTTGQDGKRYVFNWNHNRFPDPAAFVRRVCARGMTLSPNVKPGMLTSHPLYPEFRDAGAFVARRDGAGPHVDRYWGGPASFVDFTRPEARALWKEHLKKSLISMGVTSIWNDNNEYEMDDPGAQCDFEGMQGPVSALRPLLPNLMALTALEAVREAWPDVRPYILNRAGFAGIQRFAQTWAGDNYTSWKSLKFNIATILGMGLSGVANQGIDVGGFDGPVPEPELLVRWVQNAAYYPRFCIHSCNTDNTVTEPWMYPSVTPLIRKALERRYQLLPYFYALMHEAATVGSPVMRPLVYEFQGDAMLDEESFDFMVGPWLMVAGVFEKGARFREVYLPAGADWYDWDTLERYSGGQRIRVETPLEKQPVFIRSGAVIPMARPVMNQKQGAQDTLKLLIEPWQDSEFTLYDDDGESNRHEQGEYCRTTVTVTRQKGNPDIRMVREGSYVPAAQQLEVEVICREAAPLSVTSGGRALPVFRDGDAFAGTREGFWFDAQRRTVVIRCPLPAEEGVISVCFDTKDLISI